MLGIWAGTSAFGLLVLFEYQKCRSVRRGIGKRNPWFLLGTLVLLASYLLLAGESTRSGGLRLLAGALALAAGIVFYGAVLLVAAGESGYTRDSGRIPVSRTGLYGKVRHPGVWSYLTCSLGYVMIFPETVCGALWFALLNLFYTWLQDRYFFPVYLEGYEEYRREVPYLFPKKIS